MYVRACVTKGRERTCHTVCVRACDTKGEREDVLYLVCVYEVLEGTEGHKAGL